MPDIDPEEANGLQDLVSTLKSIRNRNKLTINDHPQNEFEWTLNDCIKKSRSFSLFCREVHPDYLDRLLPLCLDLDFYLDKSSTNDYLSFNIKKHGKSIIYEKLHSIWTDSMDSYTEKKWFINFIAQNTNIASNVDSVRKGLENTSGNYWKKKGRKAEL